MKLVKNGLFIALSAVLFSSCGSNSDDQPLENNTSYRYVHDNSVLEWTAYKFESKAPVKGTFTEIIVSSISESSDPKTLAESLGFTIPVSSIYTTDESRDAKIIEFFFGIMATQELTGHIVQLNEDGTAQMEVTMNGITETIDGQYDLNKGSFSLKATMDLTKWQAQKAIDVLNENCKENHTENGITKMWTEVDISFTTTFSEN